MLERPAALQHQHLQAALGEHLLVHALERLRFLAVGLARGLGHAVDRLLVRVDQLLVGHLAVVAAALALPGQGVGRARLRGVLALRGAFGLDLRALERDLALRDRTDFAGELVVAVRVERAALRVGIREPLAGVARARKRGGVGGGLHQVALREVAVGLGLYVGVAARAQQRHRLVEVGLLGFDVGLQLGRHLARGGLLHAGEPIARIGVRVARGGVLGARDVDRQAVGAFPRDSADLADLGHGAARAQRERLLAGRPFAEVVDAAVALRATRARAGAALVALGEQDVAVLAGGGALGERVPGELLAQDAFAFAVGEPFLEEVILARAAVELLRRAGQACAQSPGHSCKNQPHVRLPSAVARRAAGPGAGRPAAGRHPGPTRSCSA